MSAKLPAPVLRADEIHHRILREVAFSRHLNPSNANEARREFLRGQIAPPFEYLPLVEADDLLRELDLVEPPRDHPAGDLVGRCMDGTRLMIRALRDRTPEAFDALALAAEWYPDAELLSLTFPDDDDDDQPTDFDAGSMMAALYQALADRGLDEWRLELDHVMAARVLVDGAKRLLRVNPRARFRRRDLVRLVVHEVDVHAVRSANGQAQALRCFETGLPSSLVTEEGLAMVAEEHAGVSSPGVLGRQVEVVRAIDQARHTGFRDLYDALDERLGSSLAWGICLRVKRGLARPDAPGVYAKDSVYLRGYVAVRDWLDAGGPVDNLYVGKVAIDDPVAEWLDQGWVTPGKVPAMWRGR